MRPDANSTIVMDLAIRLPSLKILHHYYFIIILWNFWHHNTRNGGPSSGTKKLMFQEPLQKLVLIMWLVFFRTIGLILVIIF